MPILIVKQGTQKNQFALKNNVTTIGRSPDNTLFLNDPKLSRYHCQIIRTSEGYKVMDIGANGILVNGKRVKECMLNNKDIIQLGDGDITFYLTETTSNTQSTQATQVRPQTQPNNVVSQQQPVTTIRRETKAPSQVRAATPKTVPAPTKTGLNLKKTSVVTSPSKMRRPTTPYSKLKQSTKPPLDDEDGIDVEVISNPKKPLFIVTGIVIVILIVIFLIIALKQSPGKNKSGAGANTEALDTYNAIQKESQNCNYEKASELARDFSEKFKKSKYLPEVKKLMLDLEMRRKESEAWETWNPIKKRFQSAGSNEANEVISEIKTFLSQYNGTKAANEAEGELESLQRLAAQESPAIKEFNETRMNIEKYFVDNQKYAEAIKEYEKFLEGCKEDSIITGKVQREISKLKEKMK